MGETTIMDAVAAELPLYLQMSRYTKGSKALMELRTERYLAEQTTATSQPGGNDDNLITGSLPASDVEKETNGETEEEGFSFNDFLDMINPLQHLPVVSTLYREATGDEIGPTARIVGGAIYGGPIGAGISVAEAVMEQATGDDLGGHVMSMLQGTTPSPTIAAAMPNIPNQQARQSAPITADILNAQASAPLPSLSAEAFNALLTAPEAPLPAAPARQHYAIEREQNGVAAAMALALDQYDGMTLVDEPAY